jgi:succinyl-diaminopimelate desuccinylase
MKGGVAIALRLAAHVTQPNRDLTFVFYEGEEVEREYNGLERVARERPELLACDFAILMEPTDAIVEAGCQGTVRVDVITRGKRSHSARAWLGSNAVHAAGEVLNRLAAYTAREVDIDGLVYREGMNAVGISGGVAGNVVPDEARVSVNYRFAPDLDEKQAIEHVQELFDGFEVVVTDSAPGARPGLDRPAAAAFVEAIGVPVAPKFGWTDVAQFTQLGIPAVNFGPGDPNLAHTADEHVPVDHLIRVEEAMTGWLTT